MRFDSRFVSRLSCSWIGVCLAVALGCSREPPKPVPPTSQPTPQPAPTASTVSTMPLPPYARYLAGMRICLDPGHGGDANRPDYKRGPTGLREAEVNLRVALFLRDLLEASGAIVIMTRQTDTCLAANDEEDLRLRTEVACRNDCDLLLSIHHNAADNPQANYTSVWYHDDVDHNPASLDLGREVAVAMLDELRLGDAEIPLLSDKIVHAKSGFRLLRLASVPAVLCESSFHSNPAEEQRLRDPDYNRREARAFFIALARYAMGGVPRAKIIAPASGQVPSTGSAEVVIQLDDGLRRRSNWRADQRLILEDSLIVRVGDTRWPCMYDAKTNRVSLYLPTSRKPGTLQIGVQFENLFKHSNTRPWLGLQVGS